MHQAPTASEARGALLRILYIVALAALCAGILWVRPAHADTTAGNTPQTIESVSACSLAKNVIAVPEGVLQVQVCIQHLPSEYRTYEMWGCTDRSFNPIECNIGGTGNYTDLWYNATRVVHSCCPSGVGIGHGITAWIVRSSPGGCTTAHVHGTQNGFKVRLGNIANPLRSTSTAVSSATFSAGGC